MFIPSRFDSCLNSNNRLVVRSRFDNYFEGSIIQKCGDRRDASRRFLNRAYNHALTPEYYHRYSKESSIVKEIGDHKPLEQCFTLTTPTFSILKWINGTPKIVSAYPCTLNYTIEYQMTLIIPKGNGSFFSLDNRL